MKLLRNYTCEVYAQQKVFFEQRCIFIVSPGESGTSSGERDKLTEEKKDEIQAIQEEIENNEDWQKYINTREQALLKTRPEDLTKEIADRIVRIKERVEKAVVDEQKIQENPHIQNVENNKEVLYGALKKMFKEIQSAIDHFRKKIAELEDYKDDSSFAELKNIIEPTVDHRDITADKLIRGMVLAHQVQKKIEADYIEMGDISSEMAVKNIEEQILSHVHDEAAKQFEKVKKLYSEADVNEKQFYFDFKVNIDDEEEKLWKLLHIKDGFSSKDKNNLKDALNHIIRIRYNVETHGMRDPMLSSDEIRNINNSAIKKRDSIEKAAQNSIDQINQKRERVEKLYDNNDVFNGIFKQFTDLAEKYKKPTTTEDILKFDIDEVEGEWKKLYNEFIDERVSGSLSEWNELLPEEEKIDFEITAFKDIENNGVEVCKNCILDFCKKSIDYINGCFSDTKVKEDPSEILGKGPKDGLMVLKEKVKEVNERIEKIIEDNYPKYAFIQYWQSEGASKPTKEKFQTEMIGKTRIEDKYLSVVVADANNDYDSVLTQAKNSIEKLQKRMEEWGDIYGTIGISAFPSLDDDEEVVNYKNFYEAQDTFFAAYEGCLEMIKNRLENYNKELPSSSQVLVSDDELKNKNTGPERARELLEKQHNKAVEIILVEHKSLIELSSNYKRLNTYGEYNVSVAKKRYNDFDFYFKDKGFNEKDYFYELQESCIKPIKKTSYKLLNKLSEHDYEKLIKGDEIFADAEQCFLIFKKLKQNQAISLAVTTEEQTEKVNVYEKYFNLYLTDDVLSDEDKRLKEKYVIQLSTIFNKDVPYQKIIDMCRIQKGVTPPDTIGALVRYHILGPIDVLIQKYDRVIFDFGTSKDCAEALQSVSLRLDRREAPDDQLSIQGAINIVKKLRPEILEKENIQSLLEFIEQHKDGDEDEWTKELQEEFRLLIFKFQKDLFTTDRYLQGIQINVDGEMCSMLKPRTTHDEVINQSSRIKAELKNGDTDLVSDEERPEYHQRVHFLQNSRNMLDYVRSNDQFFGFDHPLPGTEGFVMGRVKQALGMTFKITPHELQRVYNLMADPNNVAQFQNLNKRDQKIIQSIIEKGADILSALATEKIERERSYASLQSNPEYATLLQDMAHKDMFDHFSQAIDLKNGFGKMLDGVNEFVGAITGSQAGYVAGKGGFMIARGVGAWMTWGLSEAALYGYDKALKIPMLGMLGMAQWLGKKRNSVSSTIIEDVQLLGSMNADQINDPSSWSADKWEALKRVKEYWNDLEETREQAQNLQMVEVANEKMREDPEYKQYTMAGIVDQVYYDMGYKKELSKTDQRTFDGYNKQIRHWFESYKDDDNVTKIMSKYDLNNLSASSIDDADLAIIYDKVIGSMKSEIRNNGFDPSHESIVVGDDTQKIEKLRSSFSGDIKVKKQELRDNEKNMRDLKEDLRRKERTQDQVFKSYDRNSAMADAYESAKAAVEAADNEILGAKRREREIEDEIKKLESKSDFLESLKTKKKEFEETFAKIRDERNDLYNETQGVDIPKSIVSAWQEMRVLERKMMTPGLPPEEMAKLNEEINEVQKKIQEGHLAKSDDGGLGISQQDFKDIQKRIREKLQAKEKEVAGWVEYGSGELKTEGLNDKEIVRRRMVLMGMVGTDSALMTSYSVAKGAIKQYTGGKIMNSELHMMAARASAQAKCLRNVRLNRRSFWQASGDLLEWMNTSETFHTGLKIAHGTTNVLLGAASLGLRGVGVAGKGFEWIGGSIDSKGVSMREGDAKKRGMIARSFGYPVKKFGQVLQSPLSRKIAEKTGRGEDVKNMAQLARSLLKSGVEGIKNTKENREKLAKYLQSSGLPERVQESQKARGQLAWSLSRQMAAHLAIFGDVPLCSSTLEVGSKRSAKGDRFIPTNSPLRMAG